MRAIKMFGITENPASIARQKGKPIMPVVTKSSPTKLTAIIERGERRFVAVCPELDLATQGETPDEAVADLIDMVIEYAEEYQAEFDLYSRSPNRASHWPYLEKVLKEGLEPDRVRDLFT